MKKPNVRWIPMLSLGVTFCHVPEKYVLTAIHATNSVLHWINAVLVGLIASYLMDPVSASMATLVFLVHPLAAPAVSPIATRAVVMATTFILLGVLSIVGGLPFLAIPCLALAALCREDAVAAIPLSLILIGLQSWTMALAILPMIVAGASLFPIRQTWYWLMERSGERGMLAAGMAETPPQPAYTITAIAENVLRWPLWFVGLGMCPDPVVPVRSIRSWQFWAALALMGTACVLLWVGSPVIQLSILLIGCSQWTAAWFVRLPDPVAESRAYPTVAGIALAVALLPWMLSFAIGLWWLLLACRRSFQQRHPIPYWLACWNEQKPKFRVAVNIGAAFQGVSDMENARKWHMKALELNPTSGIAIANLGLWYEGLSRVERHVLSQSYVQTGKIDAKEAEQRNQQSLAHLARSLQLMEQAEQACPQDKIVRQYAQMVRGAAERVGLRPAPKIHLVTSQ